MLVPDIYRKWSRAGGFWGGVGDYFARSRRASAVVYRSPYAGDDGVEGGKKDCGSLALEFYERLGEEDKVKIDAVRNGDEIWHGPGAEK